jgi:TatD DNase family protein
VNGCSLKTDANLAVVAGLPAERLLLETDAPWCGIRPSHASSRFVQTKFQEKDKKQFRPNLLVKGEEGQGCLRCMWTWPDKFIGGSSSWPHVRAADALRTE